jgi:tetratricopeptide (TPR) repeat protein
MASGSETLPDEREAQPFGLRSWHELPPRFRSAAACAAIVLLTLTAFFPALRGGFLWDDDTLLTDNKVIHADDGLYRIWFTTQPYDYFPLSWSALWLQWRVWGMDPAGYHFVNVLLHALSAILLWLVLVRLKVPCAYLATAVFAVHPVTTASVAWISEVKNTLSMPLCLGAALAFLAFVDGRGWRTYALSLALFLLALLAKTSVATLPLALLLCLWWKNGRVRWKDAGLMVPFLLLSLALGAATIWFQAHRSMNLDRIELGGDWLSRTATAAWAVWFYLYKDICPTGLTMIYKRWTFDPSSLACYLPLAALIAALAGLWAFRRRAWAKAGLFAMCCFVIMLLPVLGFVKTTFSQFSPVADHWQYLALPAAVVAMVSLACSLLKGRIAGGKAGEVLLSAAAVCMLAYLTFHHSEVYGSREALFADNLKKNNESPVVQDEVGLALARQNKTTEALSHFQEALHLDKDFANAHYNCGLTMAILGDQDGGLSHLSEAARLKPKNARYWNSLGSAYGKKGEYDKAIECLNKALRLRDDYPDAHYNLGLAFMKQDRLDEAAEEFSATLRLNPMHSGAMNALNEVKSKKSMDR